MVTRFKVNEIFDSVQGEGILVGLPSTFIRLQGCPVGCVWCDSGPLADEIEGKRSTNGKTKNTWGAGGDWMTLEEIMNQVHHRHVIITGGEPTIWNLDPILRECLINGYSTQLETAGLNALKGELAPTWVTWSPKENLRFDAPEALKLLADEVKYVIDANIKPFDIQKTIDWMQYNIQGSLPVIVLMPEGCPPSQESIDHAMELLNGNEIDYGKHSRRLGWRLQYTLQMR